jgi:HAMP domain-containing protein
MMFIVSAVRSRLSLKISLALALMLIVMMAVAAVLITQGQVNQMEEMTLEKARVAATIGARQYGGVFDDAIDAGLLTVNDVFDRSYVEIKGYAWGNNPKYHTRFDTFTDKAMLVFQDKFLEYEDFTFAAGLDENGYAPTHNSRYQKPLTGNPEKDLGGNRTKRIFADPVAVKASKNLEPTLLQSYRKDTGEEFWDVSSPIYVKGKHWGGFRIGVSMDRIEARKKSLLLSLLGIFTIFSVLTLGTMFLVVQRAMRPVVKLTAAAEQISMGEGLETPLKTSSEDEIGHLTKAIERLRKSMLAAMTRLGGQ